MRIRERIAYWLLNRLSDDEQRGVLWRIEDRLGWSVFGMISRDDIKDDLTDDLNDGEIEEMPLDFEIELACGYAAELDWSGPNGEAAEAARTYAIRLMKDRLKQ